MRLWRYDLAQLSGSVALGAGLGGLLGSWALGLAAGLGLVLGIHLYRLRALYGWLTCPCRKDPPVAPGLWGALSDRLYRDQTAQRTAQSRLRLRLERIQQSSEAMHESVVMLDRNGEIEWWNSAAIGMLGLFTDHERGRHVTDLVRDPRFARYFATHDDAEPLILISPLDERRILEYQVTRYGNGERLLVARDITRLHRLEQMRRDFVANVSHELRTPLTVLAGYLETYADLAGALPPRLGRGIEQMQAQTSRMQNLVNDLLLLSRLEIDQGGEDHAWLAPKALLERIADEARALSGRRHRVAVEVESGVALLGSEAELQSAVSNLAFNAVRYTPEGSRIVLRWRSNASGGFIEVEDDGDGIDPEHVPRLTERFYRVDKSRSTASGGTGLGLAIVKHVLLRHGAHLDIDSRPGEGALFRCAFAPAQLGR